MRRALVLTAVLALVATSAPASARYQTGGFKLDELTTASGTGPDPGPQVPAARLKWAVETAVPKEWRESVRVVWSVGEVTPGHLALSYLDGRIVISPRLMARSAEEVLATVAHEMGHQIAFALVSPVIGMPPQGFIDIAPDYADVREGWADCVARVWTGSTLITLSESGPCNDEMASYVAGLLADPATLGAAGRIVPPPIRVPSPPAPATVTVVAPEPVAAPTPEAVVVPSKSLRTRPGSRASAEAPAGAGSDGLAIALGLIPLPLVVSAAGYLMVSRRSPRLLAWATGTKTGQSGQTRAGK